MKDSMKRWILVGSFAIVLIALSIALPMLLRPTEIRLSVEEPRVVVTPEPTTEEDDIVVRTPEPTPTPLIATPVPIYPRGAINLLVNGEPLFALDNRGIAEQLINQYLEACAYEDLSDDAVLLTATIDASLSTVPADGSVPYLSVEEAMNLLRHDRTRIPVRRSVERVRIEIDEQASSVERTQTLPYGTRMFLRCGAAKRTLILTETLYRGGLAVSETETIHTTVLAGVPQTVLEGAYRRTFPPQTDPEPVLIMDEGVKGPAAVSLSFLAPMRGRLVGCYGIATGTMRYGVDYAAAPGTRIVAPESGTLIFLGERPGLGFVVEIAHDDGFVSRLSFDTNTTDPSLTVGMHVNRGETVATLPPRETAPESVLHYELLINGVPYNPLFYLPI